MSTGDTPVQRASDAFVAEFVRWRTERGLSKKQLAAAMGFDPSYISHIEARRHRPTEDFAKRAEAALKASGEIWRRFREYDELRTSARARPLSHRDPPVPEQGLPPGAGLVVERETARLTRLGDRYECTVRRLLYNAGAEPVTRYLVQISVDRYPGEHERSNQHHHVHPLTWDEIGLTASCAGEPMEWRIKTDRDAFKEAWLLFGNAQTRFPLYPGQRATITYTYKAGVDKWGHWFQRAIRLPTRRLRIELDLPVSLRPVVWGMETSMSAEAAPLRTPIEQEVDGERAVFAWFTDNPPLHARYRLEWRFRNGDPPYLPPLRTPAAMSPVVPPVPAPRAPVAGRPPAGNGPVDRPTSPAGALAGGRASERMVTAGIVQRGDPVLTTPARWFDLPEESDRARDVLTALTEALDRVAKLHRFTKGIGLAAPQIGQPVAASVVRPAGSRELLVLLNPRIIAASAETDHQFEGCLSFFDVRGLVPRALSITVEAAQLSGERHQMTYDQALARLVAHEVDHLDGHLYTDRMPGGAPLLPIEEYGEGRPWVY